MTSPDEPFSIDGIVRDCAKAYCPDVPGAEGLVACTSDDPMTPQVLGEAWAQLLAEIIVLDHGEEQKTLVGQALYSAFEVQRRVPPPAPPTARRVEDENAITINIGATSLSVGTGGGKDRPARSLEQLPEALPGGSKERTVVLVAEPGIPHGRVVEVMNVVKMEGYRRIQFGSPE